MSATPRPWRLWRVENDQYPEPHPNDRRLVGANNICIGILFGALVEGSDDQELLVRAVNAHDDLIEFIQLWLHDGCLQTFENREKFRAEARAALAKAKGELP